MADKNEHLDGDKVDLLRRKLIEGGDRKVTERFGEAELSSPEVRKAKDQVKARGHIGDTLSSRVEKAKKVEESAAKSKARSERLAKQAARRGAAVQAKIAPEREMPTSKPPKAATPSQRSPMSAAAAKAAARNQTRDTSRSGR